MSWFKFENSNDGIERCTINVKYRITREQLAQLRRWNKRFDGEADGPKKSVQCILSGFIDVGWQDKERCDEEVEE